MERFKFLEHTADAKMQAFGSGLEEAFMNAALGMFSIMFDTAKVEPNIKKVISVEGNDNKALLYNWLEELLFLMDSENFVLHEVKEMKIEDKWVEATVTGDAISEKYPSHGEVKAVTYNEMEIKEEPGKAVVQVVFDL